MIPSKAQVAEWRAATTAADISFRLGQMAMHQHRIACALASDDGPAAHALLTTYGYSDIEAIGVDKYPSLSAELLQSLEGAYTAFGQQLAAIQAALLNMRSELERMKNADRA